MSEESPTKTDESPSKNGSARKKYNVISDTQTLPARMQLLLQKLLKFYSNGSFATVVLPILKDKNPVALRDIDWLVTNYSKAFPVVYPNPNAITAAGGGGAPFNVHQSYLQHENIWKKELFDPFQRFERIYYTVNGEQIETTIAQLNFFSWAIQNGVIEWAARHREEIREHNKVIHRERKELIEMQPNREKKRMRLTNTDDTHCMVFVTPMKISLGSNAPVAEPERASTVPPPIPKFF